MTLMRYAVPRWVDMRALISLAVPVVTVQLGLMMMGVVDTIMVGHLSARALAAVALGSTYVIATSSFGMGALMALDPLVAQAVGSGDTRAVIRALQRGLIMALLLAIPTTLVLVPGRLLLTWLGQPAEIIPIAAGYAHICIPSVFAYFLFIALRQSLQAMEQVRPIVLVIIAANLVNVLLNWLLVFGKLGFPSLGALGSAWATTASRWLMAAGLVLAARNQLVPLLRRLDPDVLLLRPLWRMIRIGAPIGGHFLLEFMAFAVIALLMGWLGTLEMAAHQVALHLAALTYMVPLGVSAAAAVRVGHAVGRDDQAGIQRSALASLLCGTAFMTITAVLFLSLPGLLAALFTSAVELRLLAAALIPIAGFFQVFDGLQVVAAGILRGLGDTHTPMVVGLLGFWLIGFPVSYGLGFGLEWGATGLWWGLVAGLGSVALFLVLQVAIKLRRRHRRITIDY
jgi:MATE family multidrug resistance protein